MRKQILCILCLLLAASILVTATACNQTESESADTPSSTQAASGSTAPSSGAAAAGKDWVSVAPNVYDISAMVKPLTPLSISHIFLEQRLLLTYGHQGEKYMAIPFDLESLSLNEAEALTIQEEIGRGGVTVDRTMHGNHMVFTKNSLYERKQFVRIFDPIGRTTLAEWEFSDNTVIGTAKEMDQILLMDNLKDDDGAQRLYCRDIASSQNHPLLDWTVPDPLKKPSLVTVSQGEKGFAFTGTIIPADGQQSVMCFGLIDNEGNLHNLKKMDSFDVAVFRGGIVLFDNITAIGAPDDSLGHFEVYNADTMTVTEVKPKAPEESSMKIVVSETGQYILTGNSMGKEGVYRVYDAQKNQLIAEFPFKSMLPDANMQIAFLSEKDRGFVVLTQSNTDIQLHYFQF